jgi:hypothetical protein
MLARTQRPPSRSNLVFIGRRGRFDHYLNGFASYGRVGARVGITHRGINRRNSYS